MEISWTSAAVGAFILGILQLFWEIGKFYINRKDKKTNQEFEKQQLELEELFNELLVGAVHIQELIETFTEDNDVARVLILKMENGGGIPQLGTNQSISILNESINFKYKVPSGTVESVKQDFQHFIIDAPYQKLLTEAIINKGIVSDVHKMNKGILKTVLEANGMKTVMTIPITSIPSIDGDTHKGFLLFMSIQFVTEHKIDYNIESELLILKEKIRQTFHEFYSKRIYNKNNKCKK